MLSAINVDGIIRNLQLNNGSMLVIDHVLSDSANRISTRGKFKEEMRRFLASATSGGGRKTSDEDSQGSFDIDPSTHHS